MFAVQDSGWCAASATAHLTFDKHGKSTACRSDDEGGEWANQVYYINGTQSVTCPKSRLISFERPIFYPSNSPSGCNALTVNAKNVHAKSSKVD